MSYNGTKYAQSSISLIIITLFFSLANIISCSYQPHFIISTQQPANRSSSTAVVRETREHLAQQLQAGQNIYGTFEYQPIVHEYQLPGEEQQFLPQGFKDDFSPVGYLWHILHNPSVGYFHTKLDAKLERAPSDQHDKIMRAEMRRWGMYAYPEFREFLQDLLIYNDYMSRIARELTTSVQLKESIACACSDTPDYIAQEAQRIVVLQQRETQKAQVMKCYRDRCDAVHTIFESQRPQLEAQLVTWEQSHPDRVNAYHKTLERCSDRARYGQHHRYTLSQDADTFLRTYNLDPRNYTYGNGNAFQHELMQEIVSGIHNSAAVQLPVHAQNPFAHHVMYHTIHAFDDARTTNSMGDCVSSIKLIDIAHALLDYCKKVSSGSIDITLSSMNYGISMGKGIFYATRDAVINTANIIIHPLETLGNLLQLPFALGELMNAYTPLMPDREEATPEEWDAYFQQLPIAEENCRQLTNKVKEWWQTTPSEKIVQHATYAVASIPINAFIANRMIAFTAGALRYSKSMIMRAASRAAARLRARKIPRLPGPIYIDVEAIPISSSENILHMLQPAPTPPLSAPSIIPPSVITRGALIGISEATITKALENFVMIPDLEGCSHVIERCFNEVAHLTGFARLMKNTLTECALGSIRRGKGNFNELRSALVLKDKGHNIVKFGEEKIGDYPPDIITDQYLVECKNWEFENLALDIAEFNKRTEKLMIQLKNALKAGKIVNKKIMFMSKKPIPTNIAEKISNMGIEILEG